MSKKSAIYQKKMAEPKVASWLTILRSYRALSVYFESQMRDMGSSLARFQILLILFLENQSPVELSRRLQVSRANISTFLKRLEEDGLIKKTYLKTSKRPQFLLTKSGEAQLEKIFDQHIKNIEQVMEPFPKKQLERMEKVAQKAKDLEAESYT